MPFLFYKYGAFLRRHSKYAPSGPQPSANSDEECKDKVAQPLEDEALEPEYGPHAGEEKSRSDSHDAYNTDPKTRRTAGDIV